MLASQKVVPSFLPPRCCRDSLSLQSPGPESTRMLSLSVRSSRLNQTYSEAWNRTRWPWGFQISTFYKHNHKPTKTILKNGVLCYMPLVTARAGSQLLKIVLLYEARETPSHSPAETRSAKGRTESSPPAIKKTVTWASVDASWSNSWAIFIQRTSKNVMNHKIQRNAGVPSHPLLLDFVKDHQNCIGYSKSVGWKATR